MTRDELLAAVARLVEDYERATEEIVGCCMEFKNGNRAFDDWQLYQYNGESLILEDELSMRLERKGEQ